MPYHALELEQLPKLSAEEVLVRHGIHVMAVEDVSEADEGIQKVFLESKQTSSSAGVTTLSAYIDLRPSGRYPKTRIGVVCSIHHCCRTEGNQLSVRCRAFADGSQLGGEAFVTSYHEARNLALSFIDYAGNWIDPKWFENVPRAVNPSLETKKFLSSITEPDSPAIQATRELLNRWSTRITEKLELQLSAPNVRASRSTEPAEVFRGEHSSSRFRKTDWQKGYPDPEPGCHSREPASNSLATHCDEHKEVSGAGAKMENKIHRAHLTTSETASIWKRLCRESRGLCRLRSKNYSCSSSGSELILRRLDSSRELKVRLTEQWIVKHNGDLTETLRIVKMPRGSVIFEGTEKITSIPHLALRFIQDLAETENTGQSV
jgi:hypothetical protein